MNKQVETVENSPHREVGVRAFCHANPHLAMGASGGLVAVRRGFSLIELLVVISVIALLIAILLPVLSRARFSATVGQCASDKQQWGSLINAYAVDNDQLYPQQKIPASTGANPWDAPKILTEAMIDYGMADPRSWFCPADQTQMDAAEAYAQSIGASDFLNDLDVMERYLTRDGTWDYHLLPLSYWVPRQDNHNSYFPSIGGDPDHPDGWAWGPDDRRAMQRPILTDKLPAPRDADLNDPSNAIRFGHRAGGDLDSTSLLFGDGRVEVRALGEIKARSGPGLSFRANFYAFY